MRRILERLWSGGHAAYVVGGGVRDELLGRAAIDWDVATDALPEQMLVTFPEGRYENRFGTVGVPTAEVDTVEVTTFREDHQYADHRRPDGVTFTDSIGADLARRDFTVNAIAWGRAAGADVRGMGRPDRRAGRPARDVPARCWRSGQALR